MVDIAMDDNGLKAVWNQTAIPVILRRSRKGQQLRTRLPYAEDNRSWLKGKRQRMPVGLANTAAGKRQKLGSTHSWNACSATGASTSCSPTASRRNALLHV